MNIKNESNNLEVVFLSKYSLQESKRRLSTSAKIPADILEMHIYI